MNNHPIHRKFTLTEVMTASAIGSMAMAMLMGFWVSTSKLMRSGQKQLIFHSESRVATHKILDFIRKGKRVKTIDDRTLCIISTDNGYSYIYFVDEDNNLSTLADNLLVFDTTNSTRDKDTGETVIGRYISPFDTSTPIFNTTIASTENDDVQINFHVGDIIDGSSDNHTGRGIQGVDIRLSASCRNKTIN